jgi:hypothetical protein
MRKPPLNGRPSRDVRIALREWREPTAPDFQFQYQHRRCDRDLVCEEDGKIQYARVLEFDSGEVSDRFNAAALKAIEDFGFKADFTPGLSHE